MEEKERLEETEGKTTVKATKKPSDKSKEIEKKAPSKVEVKAPVKTSEVVEVSPVDQINKAMMKYISRETKTSFPLACPDCGSQVFFSPVVVKFVDSGQRFAPLANIVVESPQRLYCCAVCNRLLDSKDLAKIGSKKYFEKTGERR